MGDLFSLDRASQQAKQLTHTNDAMFGKLNLTEPEEIWYTSFDGKRVQAWIQKPPEDGMVRLFIDVGRNINVSPSDIVGAIANEAGVPGKVIGAIDVHDRFTLVDVPTEYARQVLQRMRGSRIRGHNANVRAAAPPEASRGESTAKTTKGRTREKGKGGALKKGRKFTKR